MSLEPTQDAWDGTIYEQEQPIAWLLSRDIVDIVPDSKAQATPEVKPINDDDPKPVDGVAMQEDECGYDFDWSKSIPKYKLEAKAAREKNRILKANQKKNPKWMQSLMNLEKEMRIQLTREETRYQSDLTHHRRDDLEFWQLLERQRKRREDRVRRRILRNDEASRMVPMIPPSVRPDHLLSPE